MLSPKGDYSFNGGNAPLCDYLPAQQKSHWSALEPKIIEEPIYTSVNDDELLLGASSLEFDDTVTIPFNPERRMTMVIQGDNASGKSILVLGLSIQLHSRFNRRLLIIDPKLDFHKIAKKNNNPAFIERLKNYDIKPASYPYAKFISPLTLKVPGSWALEHNDGYSLSVEMLNRVVAINPTAGMNAIYRLFNTEQGEATARELQKIFLSENPPKTVEELKENIKNISKPPPTLESQFELLTISKVLSNTGIYYPELLKRHNILVSEMAISSKQENSIQDIFVDNLISTCIQDRSESVASENKKGYLDEPFTIVLEEASVFAGKGRQTADIIQMCVTKYREMSPEKKSKGIKTYGCDVVLVTQHMSELDDIIVKEADWLIFPKIGDQRDADMLKLRGFDSVDIYDAMTMEYPQTYPKLWWAVDKQKNILQFYPLPTPTFM